MVLLKNVTLQKETRAILKCTSNYLDSQFLQKSQIPTLHFQNGLPRLPIPELKLTCARYLAAQRPLLTEDVFKRTETDVNQFSVGVGQQLQKILKEYDSNNKHTSYISELWFDKYLRSRTSLPVHCNPILVFNDDKNPEYNSQLLRTTNLLISSLKFYKSLEAGLLKPDIFHLNPKKSDTDLLNYIWSKLPSKLAYVLAYLNNAYPLDMSQYPNLFKSTRIPEIDKDRLVSVSNSRHVTVQYKGHFFAFDVLSSTGDILHPSQIFGSLNYILTQDLVENEFPTGVLTTLNRNEWATIRHELIENGNETNIQLIDSALFNICLDDEVVGSDPYKITKMFLHGDGTNRWFDKSFSLFVAKDGVSCVNFEHSWGDGVAVLRYTEDIVHDSTTNPQVHPNSIQTTEIPAVRTLNFVLNDHIKQRIVTAKTDYNKFCSNLDVNYTIFEGIGKAVCKKNQVSPDAIMQLGFQVGYHKVNQKFVPTYESCSTAAFKHGRTEAIRPCTTMTKELALAINSNDKLPMSEIKKMIKECSDIHNRLIKEAAMGQGFDRHLFALKAMAEQNGLKSNIFDTPEYSFSHYDIMSTSTLNSPAIYAGGFGPVVPDGFGIGYVIKDEFVGTLVTNYKNHTNGAEFVDALTQSFKEIFEILQRK